MRSETFSELCSDMLAIVREESDAAINRSHRYGWSQWPPRRARLQIVGRLSRSGWTFRRFMDELRRRTSERWVHFGPLSLLEEFEELIDDPMPEIFSTH